MGPWCPTFLMMQAKEEYGSKEAKFMMLMASCKKHGYILQRQSMDDV
jgi:hypothetical protein